MDSVLCHHRTPCRSTQGPCGVQVGRPLGLPLKKIDGGLEAERPAERPEERPAVGGGPDRNHYRGPSLRRMLSATGDKDRGLADGAEDHSE